VIIGVKRELSKKVGRVSFINSEDDRRIGLLSLDIVVQ